MSGFGDFGALMERARGMGDDRLKPTADEMARRETAFAKQQEEIKAQAAAWAEFASTPVGRRCIETLTQRTLLQATHLFHPEATAERIALTGCYREGQNDVVWQILQMIARGQGGTPEPRR